MVEKFANLMRIDLNQFKLHLRIETDIEMTLHFNSPSRQFYLSVIALVIHEMKKRGQISSIPLHKHIDVLALLNETIGGSAGSSQIQHMLPRIYRKWKDALPDLENAPLFKVVGRTKKYDELMGNVYGFSESTKDSWANLFDYKGSNEQVRLRFSIDRLDMSLDHIFIEYGDDAKSNRLNAWEAFIAHLKNEREDEAEPERIPAIIKPEQPPIPAESSTKFRLKRWQWAAFIFLFGLFAAISAATLWKFHIFPSKKHDSVNVNYSKRLPEKPAIAVLPFDNLSDDPKQTFFSDGICDDLITDLSKIPDIFVVSRKSSSLYKGKKIRIEQIAKELDVDYVLEGSVQKKDQTVRINAQLIDATSGHHLWAERYDGDMGDLFAMQDKITRKIAASLAIVLTEDDYERFALKETANMEAYEAYLKGADISNRLRFDPEGLAKSIPWFEKAISLDPNYSRAYADLAESYWRGSLYKSFREKLQISWRIAHLRRLHYLELSLKNPTNITYRNLARVHVDQYQHEKAISECMQAVTLEPNDPTSNGFMARTLIYAGKPDEAYLFIERMRRADPACLW